MAVFRIEKTRDYKTVYVSPGKTVEIEWENTAVTGQIQIYKYAAEYNEVTGTAAGTPLKGAVYEIVNARSGKVVDYITTDARGVAASKPLPLTRYQIREVTAPAYWQLDPRDIVRQSIERLNGFFLLQEGLELRHAALLQINRKSAAAFGERRIFCFAVAFPLLRPAGQQRFSVFAALRPIA